MTLSKTDRAQDGDLLRATITREIKRSGQSREQIADAMSALVGCRITTRMLTAFTAESKELHRWPAAWDIAFCEVVGSYRLLEERAKRAGFRMVGPEEEELIAIGRAFLDRKKASAFLAKKASEVRR